MILRPGLNPEKADFGGTPPLIGIVNLLVEDSSKEWSLKKIKVHMKSLPCYSMTTHFSGALREFLTD